jgi:hypothetical protein
MGLSRKLAEAIQDARQSGKVRHDTQALLKQRLLQICCGYEDVNDADTLRFDPGFQTALEKVPSAPDAALASQPTLSRLELSIRERDLTALSEVLSEVAIERWQGMGKGTRRAIILDFDSTADPTHGAQQLTMFHGYYEQWQYLPLLVFDQYGWPWAAMLRPGNSHDSRGALPLLRRLVEKIRRAFPKAEIIFRGDAGFAVPQLYEFCENAGVSYVIGQITNRRLVRRAERFLKKARRLSKKTGEKAKVFGFFLHRAGSWTHRRRIVVKAEVMAKGDNPRFVVTDFDGLPEAVYGFYTARGQMENHIKDLKNALFADRLSCHKFSSNQLRLLLHVAAYLLMFCLRELLEGTPLGSAQFDTLRLRLLKVGAKVQVTARRIWFHLASSFPLAALWNSLAFRLARASPA